MSQQSAQELALGEIRKEIDAIDRQIHQLLNQRARCAQAVAEVKSEYQQEKVVYYRPEREAQVLRKVMERNEGPLPDAEVARLFREVMSTCLALEQPLRVVFPGTLCSRSHQAAMKQFGQAAQFDAIDSIEKIFSEVANGTAHYGIVPIENVDRELAQASVKALFEYSLALCGEVSELGSRYLVIGDQLIGPSGEDKTALVLQMAGGVAELDELLEAQGFIPTALLEVDSSQGKLIYLDFNGHSAAVNVQALVAAVEARAVRCKALGSFPMAVL